MLEGALETIKKYTYDNLYLARLGNNYYRFVFGVWQMDFFDKCSHAEVLLIAFNLAGALKLDCSGARGMKLNAAINLDY